MREEIIGIMLTVALVLVMLLIARIMATVVDFCFDAIDKARRKKHPEFFQLVELCNEKGRESMHFHNTQIAPKKQQIDAILKEWSYYTAETRAEKERELEKLRQEIQSAKTIGAALDNEHEEIRDKIRVYVKMNSVEWARQMGWE